MDEIRTFIVGFVLIALIAAAGSLALSAFRTAQQSESITSVTNESIATAGTLSQGSLYVGASACRNASMVTNTIGTTCNISSTGVVTLDPLNFTGSAYIDYTHYTPTYEMNITLNGNQGISNTTSYFGTAGTIAGVSLLLFIVIGAFMFMQNRS